MPPVQPSELPYWNPDEGIKVVNPGEAIGDAGYAYKDKVPFNWLNWQWKRTYQWLKYLKEFANDLFGVEHDLTTGEHTDIHGDSIELTVPGDQWVALGIDGFIVKDEADVVDITSYPFRVNQAAYLTAYALIGEEHYSVTYEYGTPNTPLYRDVTRHYFVTQGGAQGDGTIGEITAGVGVVRQFELFDGGGETALMPFDRPQGSYIKTIGIYYIPVGDDYTLSFRVYGLQNATLAWAWDGDIEGSVTGGVGEGGVAQYKEVSFAGNGVLASASDVKAGLQFNCSSGAVVIRCVKIVYRTNSVETML